MNFISTRDKYERVSFKEATIKGLAKNKGLYVPESIPKPDASFLSSISQLSDKEIAFEVLKPFVSDDINDQSLTQILDDVLSFDFPLVQLSSNLYSLELYHGPTMAFKDVGARFMSRCMAHFTDSNSEKVTILVATSGDTGSAVANGFWKVEGVDVVILFPKDGVSRFQESQMTTLGHNIRALEVDGSFDDCQSLVKSAFSDEDLNKKMALSSANSINIARLLPQMIYYFVAYKDLGKRDSDIVFSVPSGNLGNLCAGLIAKQMGLPAHKFIAATNANHIFTDYIQTGKYAPKDSVATYSNAMDVGAPSNFERIEYLFDRNLSKIQQLINSSWVDDQSTITAIRDLNSNFGYLADPHGAVAWKALEGILKEEEIGVFLETAHPRKFEKVVQKAVPQIEFPQDFDIKNAQKVAITKEYHDFKDYLLS